MHAIIVERKNTIIKHKFMHVRKVEFEIKSILTANIEHQSMYKKYKYNKQVKNVYTVMHYSKYEQEKRLLTCFELKKMLKDILRKYFGDSVSMIRNRLYISKLLICEKKLDLEICSENILSSICKHIIEELEKK